MFIDFGAEAYFAARLQEAEPNLVAIFMAFEALSWQAMYQYQYPTSLCRNMITAKEELQHVMGGFQTSNNTEAAQTRWLLDASFLFQLLWWYLFNLDCLSSSEC
jgi:hypothetical protein